MPSTAEKIKIKASICFKIAFHELKILLNGD